MGKALNYHIRSAGKKAAEILIYEDIGAGWFGGVSAKQFADDLKAFGAVDTLNIRVNSPGGDVFEALAMYNTLRRHPADKRVSVDGMALSAATIVIMAGDHISMAENAMLMIHDPWAVTMGNADDMRQQADLLDQVKENIIVTYERRTGTAGKVLRQMMSDETWMQSADALSNNFVDEVTGDLAIAAHFDPARYKHVPAAIRAAIQDKPRSPRTDVFRARLRSLEEHAHPASTPR